LRWFDLSLLVSFGLQWRSRMGLPSTSEIPWHLRITVRKQPFLYFELRDAPIPRRLKSAPAEGLIHGERRSAVLNLTKLSAPGVYSVSRTWTADGAWVVSLSGTCDHATAGAIVPIGPGGFIRESSKFLPHSPTNAEIEASLKALARTQGEKQCN
jgi:hypothetical protein